MKKGYLLGFILVIALLAFAYFLELYKGMTPCHLCLLQRCVMALLGIIFLI